MNRRNRDQSDQIASGDRAIDALLQARPDVVPMTLQADARVFASVMAELDGTACSAPKSEVSSLAARTLAALTVAAASLLVWHAASAKKLPTNENVGLVRKTDRIVLPPLAHIDVTPSVHITSVPIDHNRLPAFSNLQSTYQIRSAEIRNGKSPIAPQVGLIGYFAFPTVSQGGNWAAKPAVDVPNEEILVCSSTTEPEPEGETTSGNIHGPLAIPSETPVVESCSPFQDNYNNVLAGQILVGSAIDVSRVDVMPRSVWQSIQSAFNFSDLAIERYCAL